MLCPVGDMDTFFSNSTTHKWLNLIVEQAIVLRPIIDKMLFLYTSIFWLHVFQFIIVTPSTTFKLHKDHFSYSCPKDFDQQKQNVQVRNLIRPRPGVGPALL